MSRRGLRPVAGVVDRLLRGLGISADVDRIEALHAWRAAATAVLGPDAASTTALRVDDRTLVVSVPAPAWASEIRLRENEIVSLLRSAAPRSGVTAIRCVPASGERPGPRKPGGGARAP